jgi:hypothetical protein
MMSHRILSAALLLCTLAACGNLPTHSDSEAQPAAPAYDESGYTMGSGNKTLQASGSGDTEVEGGGFTMGSGNIDGDEDGFGVGSGNIVATDLGYGSGHRGTADEPLPSTSTMSGDSTGRSGYTMGSGN